MKKVIFLVDGYYMYRQLRQFKSSLWVNTGLLQYCRRHILPHEEMIRIFYYDAPPLPDSVTNPLGHHLENAQAADKVSSIHNAIRCTPYVTFREGKHSWYNEWSLKRESLTNLMNKSITVNDLQDSDFFPVIKQKGVDMAFGIDIAAVATKKMADRIVLIANDLDFKPAVDFAKAEGLQVTLDPVGGKVAPELEESVDWVHNVLKRNELFDRADFFWNHKKILREPEVE